MGRFGVAVVLRLLVLGVVIRTICSQKKLVYRVMS